MIIQNDSKLTTTADKGKSLSQYVQLNLTAFQYLKNKNYKLAMSTFEKCIEIAKDLDDMKHVESLTNQGICQFFCGNFEESYDLLEKAKEISTRLVDNSYNDRQLQALHLRVISNLSLTALSLNKISECKAQFNSCIDLIKAPENTPNDKLDLLKELVYIFFRLDSLSKYYEINQNMLENNMNEDVWNNDSAQTRMVNKCLFGLHKSLRENNFQYWFNCLSEEVSKSKRMRDSGDVVFLLINQMAACYCCRGKVNDNLKSTLTNLVKYYQDQYNKDLKFKEKNINNILTDFKSRIETAVEIYKRIWDLENELTSIAEANNTVQKQNTGSKYLIKLLFKHAINFLNKEENKNDEIKNQIELALKLLEADEIDCSMISIMNINSEITKSLKILIENLCIIRKKIIFKEHFNKFKFNTIGYIKMSEHMEEKYITSENYLKRKLENLAKGTLLTKFNYTSKGFTKHYYQVGVFKENYHLIIYNTYNDLENKKPMKLILLSDIIRITYGCTSKNLKKKVLSKQLKDYLPWLFLSLHFEKRTIDLYFDNDDTINEWFLGLYYYFWRMSSSNANKVTIKINRFFFNKLKLKLLYELKDKQGDLPILEQIKSFSQDNQYEFQALSACKTILLYVKICEKLKAEKAEDNKDNTN